MATKSVLTLKTIQIFNAPIAFTAGGFTAVSYKAGLQSLTTAQQTFASNYKFFRVTKMSARVVPMQNVNGYSYVPAGGILPAATNFWDIGMHAIYTAPDGQIENGTADPSKITSWSDFINKPGVRPARANKIIYKSMVPYTAMSTIGDPTVTAPTVGDYTFARKKWLLVNDNDSDINTSKFGAIMVGYVAPINGSTAYENTNYSAYIYLTTRFEFKGRMWLQPTSSNTQLDYQSHADNNTALP